MKIKWLGHSCFLFETRNPDQRILIDPFQPGAYDGAIGYGAIREEVDIVLISHDHPDHNGTEFLPGNPLIVQSESSVRGISFDAIELDHDEKNGRNRGKVKAFLFELEGMKLTHLSDIGHIPTETQYEKLIGTQILFIPVGGRYTINGIQAREITDRLQPNLVFPMHYKTSKIAMAIDPVDAFFGDNPVPTLSQSTLVIKKEDIPQPIQSIVLTPEN